MRGGGGVRGVNMKENVWGGVRWRRCDRRRIDMMGKRVLSGWSVGGMGMMGEYESDYVSDAVVILLSWVGSGGPPKGARLRYGLEGVGCTPGGGVPRWMGMPGWEWRGCSVVVTL